MYGLRSDIEPARLQDGGSSSCFPFIENAANHFVRCNGMPTDPPQQSCKSTFMQSRFNLLLALYLLIVDILLAKHLTAVSRMV